MWLGFSPTLKHPHKRADSAESESVGVVKAASYPLGVSLIRKGRGALLLVAAIVVVAAGLYFAKGLVVPFLLAAFITAVTAPLVTWLRDRRVPTALAVAFGLVVDLLAVVAFGLLAGVSFGAFAARAQFYQERLGLLGSEASAWLTSHGVDVSADVVSRMIDPGRLVDLVSALFRGLTSMVSLVVLVLLMVGFMLVESTTLDAKLKHLLRDRADAADLEAAGREIKAYLLAKTATSIGTGLVAGLWCQVLGVDLPVVWGLLAFLLNYIPTLGSLIAAVPPTLLALVIQGPATALTCATGYLIINGTIGSLVEPRLMGKALGLSPLVVFMSMVVWGWLLGPVGALFSGPLTMLVKTWLRHTEDLSWVAPLLESSEVVRKAGRSSTA